MKEVYLYEKKENKAVQCRNCAHYCVISDGRRGICGVRENQNGILYAINYGKIISLGIDPIEKKPFFHFLPGTNSLSVASVGCNLKCENCQNYDISQAQRFKDIPGEVFNPEEIVKVAIDNKIPSISYTYTEPAMFSEFAVDTMKLAKEKGIKNAWVSNGFWSEELFEMVSPLLDAVKIDLKSFSDGFYKVSCGAKLQPILDTLKRIKDKGIFLEVVTLVIPTKTDSSENLKKIAEFMVKNLGADTPWHITQFSGKISWKLQHLPETPTETLLSAFKIGKEAGLKYVYTGNIPGMESENTFCPKCNEIVIERFGYQTRRKDNKGRCPKCKEDINIYE